MKILFVIRDMFMGGAGKQLSLTASALIDRGHDVVLYTYIGETLEHKIDKRIKYIPELNVPTNKFLEYVGTPNKIRKVVKSEKPDLVISWRANAGCMTVLGCIGLNVKIVYSERSDPYMETNAMLKIATKICAFSDGGVFQTSQARDYYKRLKHKSIVLPNPVVLNHDVNPVPLKERKEDIVWVGRIKNSQKRIDVLLNAFKCIHGVNPKLKLSIYGDGPDEVEVKNLVKQLGIQDYVVFHGSTDNVLEVIKNYSLMILSSDYEGIPNVIIEAFMSEVPVVSTDCSPGGARVLIEDGVNGFIVPIRDYKALSERACHLLDDPMLAEQFIEKSKDRLKKFDSATIFDKWNSFLERLVSN